MNLCLHFGLTQSPFNPAPDAAFFFASPTHEEALATLQYTISAKRGCAVVVGESGLGKSLLVRMLSDYAAERADVLLVQGIGQPQNATLAALRRASASADTNSAPPAQQTTLAAWRRCDSVGARPGVLIVDNAEELHEQGWRDIIALGTADAPLTVVLLGAPRLLTTLARPDLARVQRRVFRTVRLEPLTRNTAEQYVQMRIKTAGGDGTKLIGENVPAQLFRLTSGNPALINQLCDNALLEAFSERRDQITIADIGNAMYAILGGDYCERPALGDASDNATAYPRTARFAVSTRSKKLAAPPTTRPEPASRIRMLEQRLASALRTVHRVRTRDMADDRLLTGESSGETVANTIAATTPLEQPAGA